jgi:hypothetical protein
MNIAYIYEDDPLFERKIENAATGLKPACKKILKRVSKTNAVIVADYITSMQTEMNRSDDYKKAIIMLLCKFSQINKDKTFKQMTRQDVISFLDRLRKPETADPLHKWIGTYNLYGIYLLRFFKWLYHPVEPNKRPTLRGGILPNIHRGSKVCRYQGRLHVHLTAAVTAISNITVNYITTSGAVSGNPCQVAFCRRNLYEWCIT